MEQLDGYLAAAAADGKGVQNGILTDGRRWLERNVGDGHHAMAISLRAAREFDRPEQAVRLREFLNGIIDRNESDLSPNAANLARYFGVGAPLFRASNHLLPASLRQKPGTTPPWRSSAGCGRTCSRWPWAGTPPPPTTKATGCSSATPTSPASSPPSSSSNCWGDVARYAEERPDELLKGRILAEQSDLHGIIDADLFTWPTEIGESAYLRAIARQVERFNWADRPREVAPTLYQNVITPEERKRLGEYYTPRWLAQAITATVVADPPEPAGDGPPAAAAEPSSRRRWSASCNTPAAYPQPRPCGCCRTTSSASTFTPVAVQLAKATWVMAAADTIRAARAENPDVAATTAPIYLGDSMQLRYDTGTLSASQTVELNTGEILPGETEPVAFSIPRELARRQADVDRLIAAMAAAIDEGRDAQRLADDYPMSDDARRSVKAVAAAMGQLHDNHRNHVWAYYIRNMIRPAIIAEEKVDAIIGNPPWLTYGQSADIIREELRGMSESRYQIWAGGKLAPHQDIATLFYTRCAELYAKPGAQIGMVLPHSVLRAGQHLKWRSGNYRRKGARNAPGIGLNLRVQEPWDLDNVVPDFFPMPAQRRVRRVRRHGRGRSPGAGNRPGLARQLGRRLRRHHQSIRGPAPRRRHL